MTSATIRIEPISPKRRILVSDAHTFGTDAFLLADFAAPRQKDNAVDLGTGCGIIPTLWLEKETVRTVLGIELQEQACELARKTAQINGDSMLFEVMHLDMRSLAGRPVERERFDLVTCNPPYFVENSGYISPDPARAPARSELQCSIDDVCAAAKYLLKYGGRLCMCHRPERLADVICAMRAAGIEPKRMRMVHYRAGKAPWLVLIEGRRGGKPSLDIMPPMYMFDDEGQPLPELENMYGNYRDGRGSK